MYARQTISLSSFIIIITILLECYYLVQCTDILIVTGTADWIFMAGCREVIWDESVETFSVSNNHKRELQQLTLSLISQQSYTTSLTYHLQCMDRQHNIWCKPERTSRLEKKPATVPLSGMSNEWKLTKWSPKWLNLHESACNSLALNWLALERNGRSWKI